MNVATDVVAWCSSMVQQYGAVVWCSGVVQLYGAVSTVDSVSVSILKANIMYNGNCQLREARGGGEGGGEGGGGRSDSATRLVHAFHKPEIAFAVQFVSTFGQVSSELVRETDGGEMYQRQKHLWKPFGRAVVVVVVVVVVE